MIKDEMVDVKRKWDEKRGWDGIKIVEMRKIEMRDDNG